MSPIEELIKELPKISIGEDKYWPKDSYFTRENRLIEDYSVNKRYIRVDYPENVKIKDLWKNPENGRVYFITRIIKDKLYCKIAKRKIYRHLTKDLPILLLVGSMEG